MTMLLYGCVCFICGVLTCLLTIIAVYGPFALQTLDDLSGDWSDPYCGLTADDLKILHGGDNR